MRSLLISLLLRIEPCRACADGEVAGAKFAARRLPVPRRRNALGTLQVGDALTLMREPDNAHDRPACASNGGVHNSATCRAPRMRRWRRRWIAASASRRAHCRAGEAPQPLAARANRGIRRALAAYSPAGLFRPTGYNRATMSLAQRIQQPVRGKRRHQAGGACRHGRAHRGGSARRWPLACAPAAR